MKITLFKLFLGVCFFSCLNGYCQTVNEQTLISPPTDIKQEEDNNKKDRKWFNAFSIRGYGHFRYNNLFQTNKDLRCDQCDKSWGGNSSFSIRRLRVVFYGNIHDRVYFYVQHDFATSNTPSNLNFGQLRDAYIDLFPDKKKQFRFRIGQSKIPYSFENLQSSSNRLTLDRSDAINSSSPGERDLGIFILYTPTKAEAVFSEISSKGLKGSGNYGVLNFGVYNGQGGNKPEANSNKHFVARLTYPFKTKRGQIIEAGIQAYTGKFVLNSVTEGVETINENNEYLDQRAAVSFIWYAQPFGIQTEYNVGRGPEYNPLNNKIEEKLLHGGYILANYMIKIKKQTLIPFAKYHYYDGGRKFELDARSYNVSEFEIGLEWQPIKYFELSAQYTISKRRFEDAVLPNNLQQGRLLRVQAQFSF